MRSYFASILGILVIAVIFSQALGHALKDSEQELHRVKRSELEDAQKVLQRVKREAILQRVKRQQFDDVLNAAQDMELQRVKRSRRDLAEEDVLERVKRSKRHASKFEQNYM
ncbi:uncharacterized protein LOC141902312 [Tubulanus polymorphus]|uniref:uncharacterized protein LOC141902312 n=1 Tax=Tubulanus polymorphus TaxID=672921 RepID=UPI003DA6BBE9